MSTDFEQLFEKMVGGRGSALSHKDGRLPEAVAHDLQVRHEVMLKGMAQVFKPGDLVTQQILLRQYDEPDIGQPAVVLEVYERPAELCPADGAAPQIHRPTAIIGISCGCGCGIFKRYPAELWRFIPWTAELSELMRTTQQKGQCDA